MYMHTTAHMVTPACAHMCMHVLHACISYGRMTKALLWSLAVRKSVKIRVRILYSLFADQYSIDSLLTGIVQTYL